MSAPQTITQKIVALAVGKSCVVNTLGPLRYARRQHPDRTWRTTAAEGRYVVTRTA
ncbi:hypothetical protein [Phenylobacterium sp.]|uniref:hypothetical protein n=1 Tax=Phenylobacterium sp. TaxID=1871053 RepID=UPI0035AEAFF2